MNSTLYDDFNTSARVTVCFLHAIFYGYYIGTFISRTRNDVLPVFIYGSILVTLHAFYTALVSFGGWYDDYTDAFFVRQHIFMTVLIVFFGMHIISCLTLHTDAPRRYAMQCAITLIVYIVLIAWFPLLHSSSNADEIPSCTLRTGLYGITLGMYTLLFTHAYQILYYAERHENCIKDQSHEYSLALDTYQSLSWWFIGMIVFPLLFRFIGTEEVMNPYLCFELFFKCISLYGPGCLLSVYEYAVRIQCTECERVVDEDPMMFTTLV